MNLQRKLLIVALASAMPMASVYAQSAADLQKDIAALKAQLQLLQQKVDALVGPADAPPVAQQITRIEQKQELADEVMAQSGLKGMTFKGVVEAAYGYDSSTGSHSFGASDGTGGGGNAMLELTKETEDGEGVNWTLRLTPGAASLVQEATVSVGVAPGMRVFGGLVPDFQGYESLFAHQNPLVSHNALYDLAGPTNYSGIGMMQELSKDIALKWIVGNIDSGSDVDAVGTALKPSVGLAYRFDWTVSQYSYLGFSGAHSSSTRAFDVLAVDGGFTRGDWQFNGQLTTGQLKDGAYAGGDASWTGVSGLVGYKLTPRLQLLARADYVENRKNGGGTYVYNYLNNPLDTLGSGATAGTGLGPEMDSAGAIADPTVGANLTRLSLGSHYLLNASTQWKTEIRFDQSSGYNFTDENGAPKRDKLMFGTSLVVSF